MKAGFRQSMSWLHTMAMLPDGEEKIALLGQITQMETARKDLQAQVYGNNVG